MKASVTLKQGHGLTYTTRGGRTFKSGVTETLTEPRDIAEVQNNERFSVSIHDEKPTVKVKAAPPPAEPAEDEEPPLDAVDTDEEDEEPADEDAEPPVGDAGEAAPPKKPAAKPRAKAAKAKV